MNAELSLKLARRFIELPTEKRRLFLEGLQQEGVDFALLPIPGDVASAERDGLSYAQQRMWFLWQLDPHSAAYNLPMAVRLKGALDVAALHSAFNLLVARHETLRTLFHEHDEKIRQHVLDSLTVGIQRHDLSALQPDDREAQVTLIAETEACAPFDLVQGPLLRVQLLTLAADEHVLLLTLHHIVADGWSLNVLIEEFLRCYDAACSGTEAALTVLPIQYRDYALWQRSWLEAGEQDRQLAYWRDKLGEDHTPLELPSDHPRPSRPSYRGARHPCPIDGALAERLRALAKDQGVTLFMVLLAAFKVLLHRYSGQTAIRVGVPVANRNRGEVEGLIGCFINTQVLHTEIDPLHDVHALLSRIKDTALGAQAHQELPFERLVEALALDRSSPSPLFQVLFNHQASIADAGQIRTQSGLSVEKLTLDKHSARFDLALDTYESAGQLHAVFTYALDVFDGQTIAEMGEHWLHVLHAMVAAPHNRIGDLTLNAAPLPSGDLPEARDVASVHALIERAAERHPQQVAAVSAGEKITYAALQQRSDALAQLLLEKGAQPDQRIGVLADRSVDMLVAIVAVLKAGAAYLPLEPEQPAERLAFMLADSQVRWVLGRDIELPGKVQLIAFDAALPAARLRPVPVHADNLAYVIYTSGTTGMPKGVAISHGALANYVSSIGERLPLGAVRSLAMVTTPAADLGHTMFYGALCAGKTLHLLDKQTVLDADVFAAYMREHAIDALKIVPSHLQAMLTAGAAALPRRVLIVGGEAVAPALLKRVTALAPVLRVINHYGPTETTVGVLTHELAGEPLLGRALDNIRAQVLSDCVQPVPGAAKGELYIGGAGLARGYLGKPALTAERFVPDPANAHGERMYRTGDWVRAQRDGVLRFIGRMDGQVKIRGYRVELAEVESRVRALAGVVNAVVRLVGEGENQQLAAYVVPASWAPDAAAQRAFAEHARHALKALLPDYLQPQHWQVLERLPVTANGKLDSKALPAPVAVVSGYQAPVTELQAQVAAIWAEVLQVEQVGLADNFFALGGHSLLATQVVSRVRRQLRLEVALRVLFDTADLGEFTAALQGVEQAVDTQIPALDRSQPLMVSHAQHRQWLFWKLNPQSTAYNTPLAVRLQGTLDADALQAALDTLVARHESLRTVFDEHDGQTWQRVHAATAVPIEQVDLSAKPGALPAHLEQAATHVFDLAQGPLIRATLFKTAADEHVLAVVLHHIVSDGWSMSVMVRELAASYNASAAGLAIDRPALAVQYADYSAWQRQRLASGELQTQLAFWKAELEDDFALLELPADRSRPQVQSYRGARVDVWLPADLVRDVRRCAQDANATLFHVFLASFVVLLSRYSGRDTLNIGIPVTNRNRLELEGLIGFFVNTIVARVALAPGQPFGELLAQVKDTTLAAQANKDIPFDALVEALKPERGLGHNPLFQVMFNHLSDLGERLSEDSVAGLRVSEVDLVEHTTQFDLSLDTLERSDGIMASFGYATDLFDSQRIEALAEHWQWLLAALVRQPDKAAAEVPLLDLAEVGPCIERGDESPAATFQQSFEAQASLTPDATALVLGDRSLTYQGLNRRANRLAHKLRELGVGPDVRVGIAVERSLEMVIGLLGILKAGGAYVPLDPHYPAERLSYMLEDSGIELLLTQADLQARLPQAQRVTRLLMEAGDEWLADYSDTDLPDLVVADNLAYVIYTSGSTGKPKGVAMAHRQLSLFCAVAAGYSRLTCSDRVLQFATVNFDGFVEQLYPALCCGAQVIMRGPEVWDIDTLVRKISAHGVTVADLPTAYWRLLAAERMLDSRCPSLRQVHVGGEAMPMEAMSDWWRSGLSDVRLLNTYGPTEATVVTTVYDCAALSPAQVSKPGVAIGHALQGRRTYVCDNGLQLAPPGWVNELLIGGAGCLARGYFNRPALTAERFIPDPFDAVGGARLYRTGDLASCRPDGVLEYAGRIDHQVKIRGLRIEMGEIEAHLVEHPDVREALVLAIDTPTGKQLAAYLGVETALMARSDGPDDLRQQLRALLKASLPEYMVPAHLVCLAALPLTANGKLDRRALPAPDVDQARQAYEAPRSDLQVCIAAIWAEVLKVERVGLTDHFFELGGHSLLATQVTSRIRQALGREVPLRTLFEAPQLTDFVDLVEHAGRDQAPALQRQDRTQPLLLSYAQQRQWFLWQLEPENAAYTMATVLQLTGRLDIEALRLSFEALIARHETLRTTFRQQGDQAVQVIHPTQAFALEHEVVRLPQGSAARIELERLVAAQTQRPFDLEQGPLLRVKLLALGSDEHVLILTLHHIVSDGWSMPVMVEELVRLYEGYRTGQVVSLVQLSIQYVDYALWQRQWMAAGEQARQLAYWQAQLGDEQPVLELPLDRPRPAVQDYAGASLDIALDETLVQSLRQLAQQRGATLFMVLLASFQTLLHRYSGQNDIRVGVPIANRNRMETERLIGFFVNTQVLKAEFAPLTTFTELLKQVQHTALTAQAHQDLPFEQLVEALQPERSLSHSPLFQVMYNHQREVKAELHRLPELTVQGLLGTQAHAKFDLSLDTCEHAQGIVASLTYATALFDVATVERLGRHWLNLLQGIVKDPEQRLAVLPMLDTAEHDGIVARLDNTHGAYASDRCVHQLVADQAERTPDAPAVLFDDRQLTYRQLDTQANRLAHRLIELGVGPEVRVAIAMRRSAEIMVAFLAVLKAGGAYVPLDVAYPPERLLYMMNDCAAALVLTQSDLLDTLAIPQGLATLLVDQPAAWQDHPVSAPLVALAEDNLAYVIYTSGSTGLPKGVAVAHGPLVAHIIATGERYETSPADCELHFMSFAFDGAHEGWMHPLINGARVLVRDDSLWLPEQTYAQMHRHGVTIAVFPPVYLQQLAEHARLVGNPPPTRVYCFGGDAVAQSSYELAWQTLHPQYLFNGYGPTETVVTPLLWKAGKGEPCGAAYMPIGTLLGRRRAYVLGANLDLLPSGFAGELYLGGHGVARGYLDRPSLTAERFVPDMFGDGERLYRSGDLTRVRADGVVDYLGRIDHQVKVRGFRIELGEIEARLQQHAAVRETVVIDIEGPSGKQLVAYIVAPGDTDLEQQGQLRSELRDHLKSALPDYMVPAYLMFLTAMPLTPNGKLNRKGLPKPDTRQSQQVYVAPRSELEQQIAAIWAEVLKVEKIGLTDNFFELGGDSIISIQVVSRARQAGIRFTPKALFQHQTVQGLASVATRGDDGGLKIDQRPVTGEGVLLPIHQHFFEQQIPERHHWNQALLLTPGKALQADRLESALQALVAHHDALRLSFAQADDGRWAAHYGPLVQTDSLLWQSSVQTHAELESLCSKAQRSLNLQTGPLIRAVLATLADGSQRLLLAIHHLAVDGVSWRILLEDLQNAYAQLQAQQSIELPAKTSSTKAWGELLQTYARTDELQRELAYWADQLPSVQADLPCDHPQGSLQGRHAGSAQTRLDQTTTQRLLKDAPAAYRTQINDLLLTALARVIARWTGQEDVFVQLEGHGREDLFDSVDLTRTVGWFTSLFPVRLSPAATLAGSIKQIKEQLRAIPNKGIGFGALRYLGDEQAQRTLAGLAAARITFNYLGQFDASFAAEASEAAFLTPAAEAPGPGQDAAAPLANWLSINGQVYGGELSLGWSFSREMFSEQTIQRLADDYAHELQALIQHCASAETVSLTPSDVPLAQLTQAQLDSLPIAAADIEDLYPLSPMQQGMLFHSLYEQESGDYINQTRVDVAGLDVERFQRAWQAAVDRHEVLRANFVTSFEQPLQVIRKHMALPFTSLDWSNQADVEQRLDTWAEADRHAGFDLQHDALLRIAVIRTQDNSHHLIYTNHHILMDGWSNAQLLGEVLQTYAGIAESPQGSRFRDYIDWLQRQDKAQSEAFWRAQLRAVEAPTLLAQAIGQDADQLSTGYGERLQVLSIAQTRSLSEFARGQRVTVNTLVQAAWLLLLQRYTGQACVAFGATVSGRPAELKGVEQQLGLFINTLPVIASPTPEQTVAQWLEQVQAQNVSLREYEHTPLAEVQRWAGQGGESLFDNILVFENYPVSEALQQGAPAGLVFQGTQNHEQTHYPLTLAVGLAETLTVHYSYERGHYTAAMVEQVAGHFANLLQALTQDPQHRIGDLPLLGVEEHRQIVADWNATQAHYPSDSCIHQLIEAQVEATPDAIALVFGDQQLTYRDLNRRCNQLAHTLRELGVGPDRLVGVAVERSVDMVVGLLGILKAGGAYVPLDPEYPQDRLAYMMEDSGIALLLTQTSLQGQLPVPAGVECLMLDQAGNGLDAYSSANPHNFTQPQNLAYVIYTSGSTGKPKGAGNSHTALVNRLNWMQQAYGLDASDTVLQKTPFSFDVSVWEFFWPLINGARLAVAQPGDHRDPERLAETIQRYDVTTLHFVPSMLQAFMGHEQADDCTGIKRIVCSGEALPADLAQQTLMRLPHAELYNLYGPTEAAIDVTHWNCDQQARSSVPIGQPIDNLKAHILSDSLLPIAQGTCGELYLGGIGLARGYHQRPALTAERFIPDPLDSSENGGGRLYRTGDLARYQEGGVIDYVGRIDHQVKIRGLRIELGEIQARLQEHEALREAVVVDIDGPSGKQLVAYLVVEGQPFTDTEQQNGMRNVLREHLKAQLPDYMVPTHLIFIEQMPVTANGKLDRKALPKPDATQLQHAYVAPQSELEQQIAAIWADVLKVEKIGLTDNFFELGGDSIISIQVVSRARQAGIRFTPKQLFQHQTVQGLASVATRGEDDGLQIDQGPVTGAGLLLPIHLSFFEQPIAERHHWNQALLLTPGNLLQPEWLESALQALVAHHDALRLGFAQQGDGRWAARYLPVAAQPALLWQARATDAAALQALCTDAQRSLNLQTGPLLRGLLATLADGSQRLLLAIHHLAVDGVSWRILLEDLQTAYGQLQAQQRVKLPAKTSSTHAWAEQLQAYASSDALQKELGYWQAQRAAVSVELPCENPRGSLHSRYSATALTRLDQGLTQQLLKAAPAAYRTQVNDLLLTALARVIARWTGHDDVLVQLEGHGREDLFDTVDLTRTVGWFTSLFPVKLSPTATLASSIKQIKEQLRAIPNKGIGFGVLRHLGDDQARQTLAGLAAPRITFNYLGQLDGSFDGERHDAAFLSPAGEGSGASQSAEAPLANWLSINGSVYGGQLSLEWTFSREMFAEATLQRLADEYAAELKALIEHCMSQERFALTPADVPLAKLDQGQLDALPIAAAAVEDIYPLSPMQQGMLFHSLYEQQGGDYINQTRVDVMGLDVERFRQAWQVVMARHEVLRANFVTQFDQPLQVIRKQVDMPFVSLDWSATSAVEQALDSWAEADRGQGFDLLHDALLRLAVIRTSANTHHLIYTHHHILMDGWSTSQLLGEVLQHYGGVPAVPQASRYRDYIQWLQRQDAQTHRTFWREQLLDLQEPTRLALAIRQEPASLGQGYTSDYRVLDAQRTRHITEFARQQRVTVNTLVQACWILLLQRYTGQACVSFGATVSGRPAELKGVEQQIGLFINTLPVIASPQPEQSVAQWLAQVQALNLRLREHEHTPLYEVQRWAGLGGEGLFDNILVFENYPIAAALQQGSPAGLAFTGTQNHEQTNFPLTLGIGLGDVLSVNYNYDRAHFSAAAIAQIAEHFGNLLAALVQDPAHRIGDLPLLAVEAHQRTVVDWNHTEADYPRGQCIHQLIEAQEERSGEAIAVVFADRQLTYRQLNAQANQLAHTLRDMGVAPDVLVGVAVERSVEMVVALLGILKAGGAYVPLDPEYPQDRLAYMIEDSGIALLLTQQSLREQLPIPSDLQCLMLDQGADWQEGSNTTNPLGLTDPQNLAYVIYTSGSTGKPKGAGNSHTALVNRLNWMQQAYGLDASDTVLQKTPFSFDVSVWEFFWPLINGARLAVAQPGDHRDPERLAETIRRYDVTTLHFVPSMLQAFMGYGQADDCTGIKRIVCSGEALPADLAQQTLARLPNAGLYNLYGPTEAAIDVTHWTCDQQVRSSVPIGQPIDNLKTHILSDSLLPIAQGTCGELYLGGIGLARGYHQRPALTAERFIPDPLDSSENGGGRLYRTGDLARYQEGGVIDYVGRIDHQVKIRGLRIELGEIQARLQEHEALREAVVIDIDGPSGKQLVAYLVVEGEPLTDIAQQNDQRTALRDHLKAQLPDYMVPTHLIFIEQMPVTANGKLDRKALPKPDATQLQHAYVAPQSELEQQIAAIWADVLKVEKIGLTDNFFELGGDSIISIQVVSRARQAGIRFTPKQLFQHQTVQGLASVATRGEDGSLQIDQGPVTGAGLLLPIHLSFFQQAIAERHHWNQALLLTPGNLLQPEWLESALQALVIHHDALRLNFVQGEQGHWIAHYRPFTEQPALLWHAQVQDEVALEALCTEAQRSLNLQTGPLLRAVLATLADGSQRLLLAIHHLAVDGVSWRILLQDLQTVYGQLQRQQPIRLPAKTSSTKVWAERLQAYASSEELQGELHDWQRQLAGIHADLPCDNPQGSLQGRYADVAHTRLDKTVTQQLLKDAPAAYRTQINDLLLTALARVIARWTGRDDVLVQLEGHGREDLFDTVDLTRTVGWFTSLFPVKLSPTATLAGSIKQIKEQLRAIPNKGIGFGVLRYLGDDHARQTLAGLAAPRITFNYLGQLDGGFAEQASEAVFLEPAAESSGAGQNAAAPLGNWLSINVQVYAGELNVEWTYSRQMFSAATLQRLAGEYAEELKALTDHCVKDTAGGLTPSDVPLATLSQLQLDDLPIAANEIEDIFALSPMQQGMLFHSLLEANGGDYINQLRVDVAGLDVERFRRAWQTVVDRHEVLRANFVTLFEQPLQVIRKRIEMPFVSLDWRAQADIEPRLNAWAEADRHTGFDLVQDALLRIALIQTSAHNHHLIYTSHHILMDGWSNSQLLGEVLQAYAGATIAHQGGRYRDYIQWLQSQDKAQSEAFWRKQCVELEAPTRLALAIRQDRGALAHGYGDHYQTLDAQRTRALGEFARRQRVTVNTLVQAAWLLLLQRYTGHDCVTFGATVAGRPAELRGVEQQLGLFINTLAVIASPKPEQSVAQWLAQVQAQNLSLREHEHTPLFEVQRWAGQGGESLFDNILVFENYPVAEALQQGAPSGLVFQAPQNHEQTHYPLTLAIGLGEELSVHYSYDRSHFTDATIQQIAMHFSQLLQRLVEDPQQPVGDLPLLSVEARSRIVVEWNRAETNYSRERCIHRLIETQAARTPDALALVFDEHELTYQALNDKANQLAHKLRALGIGPDRLVGVAVERGLEMIVGVLAILKAGGAYVPLDPEYPQDRLAYMMADSGIQWLLTQSHLLARLSIPSGISSLILDQDGDWLDGFSTANPGNTTHPDNLAYVMYTSGSTGRPKGVAISHDALSKHAQVSQGFFGLTREDCILQFATFNFDGFVEQLYPALMCGARVVIRGKELWDSETFYRELLAKDISVVDLTTAYWFMLAKDFASQGPRGYGRLRQLHAGGEAMAPEGVAAWKQAGLAHVRLLNTYGPTEATVTVSTHDCAQYLSGAEPLPTLMPIGKVLAGRTLYLIDAQGNLAVPGSIGELTIGGDLLARGYFNRAAMTAERFIPDPFDSSEQGGGRLYRSGDLTRHCAAGVIEYVGRIDHQVKIRGLRIELGEIEARLQEHASVRETLVVDIEGPGGKQLVAYVVADLELQSTLRNELRQHLKSHLPDYMVPAHLVFLADMPLTPNGKLDRKALPPPDAAQLQQAFVAPQTELEQQIAAIWAEVLKIERVGLSDHFFELGGHSLLATQMVVRLRNQTGIDVSLRELFEQPVLQDLAQVLQNKSSQLAPLQSELAKSLEALKRLTAQDIDELTS
ncbi:MAG: non-ribosomal peptide synthase/polyketide synthase [Janthinobacterium lividum]